MLTLAVGMDDIPITESALSHCFQAKICTTFNPLLTV
jgi:hypothetical protein